jgi:lipopolysaccharide export system protein LptA
MRSALLAALALGLAPAAAATKGSQSQPVSILPGGDAKQPISIEADQLDYFEKEGKAIYNGHVVVVQGDTKLTCSKLTIFMEKTAAPGSSPPPATPEPAKAEGAPGSADTSSRLKHMDCAGPVTVLSKTQTATADTGSYDKGHNNVVLTGHVVLTDGRNVTKGDRLVYDLNSGQAAVQGGSSRVQGLFLPGSADPAAGAKKK